MLAPSYTNQFKKDYKRILKRNYHLEKLEEVVKHTLKGEYKGCLECHIEPDWLLIYIIDTAICRKETFC